MQITVGSGLQKKNRGIELYPQEKCSLGSWELDTDKICLTLSKESLVQSNLDKK